MTLTEFLLARIAVDKRIASAAVGEPSDDTGTLGFLQGSALSEGDRIVAHPTRVLAECKAKRRIVEYRDEVEPWITSDMDVVLGYLAVPYAEHPDYREEWRP